MSDVEVMREAVRVALSALVSTDAPWVMRCIPASFTQNYHHTISNYRMGKQELELFIQQTGEEARWLLDQLAQQAESELQRLPEVVQLARIWEEQYQYVNEPERLIAVRQGDDKVINRIRNPHDPDVTYGTKGRGTVSWAEIKKSRRQGRDF